MVAVRLNSLSADLFSLRQELNDLKTIVASTIPASELEQRNRHNELKDQVTQALVEFGKKFEDYDQSIHELNEHNVDLQFRLTEACEALQQNPPVAQHDISTPQPAPQPPGLFTQAFPGCGPPTTPLASGGTNTSNVMPPTTTHAHSLPQSQPTSTAGLFAPISMATAQPMPAAGSVAPQTQGFVGQHAAPVHVQTFMGAASDNVASEYGQGH